MAAPRCFFDPDHLATVGVLFAADGGEVRPVPACEPCGAEVLAGRAPRGCHPAPVDPPPARARGGQPSELDWLDDLFWLLRD